MVVPLLKLKDPDASGVLFGPVLRYPAECGIALMGCRVQAPVSRHRYRYVRYTNSAGGTETDVKERGGQVFVAWFKLNLKSV